MRFEVLAYSPSPDAQQCATFVQQYLLSVGPGIGLNVILVLTLALPFSLPIPLLGVIGVTDDPQPGYQTRSGVTYFS